MVVIFVCILLSTSSSFFNLMKMKPQEQMFFKDPVNIIHTRLERIAQVCVAIFLDKFLRCSLMMISILEINETIPATVRLITCSPHGYVCLLIPCQKKKTTNRSWNRSQFQVSGTSTVIDIDIMPRNYMCYISQNSHITTVNQICNPCCSKHWCTCL